MTGALLTPTDEGQIEEKTTEVVKIILILVKKNAFA